MSDEIKVSKVVITIGNTEVSVTPDQLKELKEAIDAMFPQQRLVVREVVYRDWMYRPFIDYVGSVTGSVSISYQNDAPHNFKLTA